jgi:hypothetical protein
MAASAMLAGSGWNGVIDCGCENRRRVPVWFAADAISDLLPLGMGKVGAAIRKAVRTAMIVFRDLDFDKPLRMRQGHGVRADS